MLKKTLTNPVFLNHPLKRKLVGMVMIMWLELRGTVTDIRGAHTYLLGACLCFYGSPLKKKGCSEYFFQYFYFKTTIQKYLKPNLPRYIFFIWVLEIINGAP